MKRCIFKESGFLLLLTLCVTTIAYTQGVGVFDGNGDVGTDVKPGSAIFDPKLQQYEVAGAGYNIWADHDEFHFLWKKIKGDFIVYARGEFVGKGVELHRKFGWMARTSLDGNLLTSIPWCTAMASLPCNFEEPPVKKRKSCAQNLHMPMSFNWNETETRIRCAWQNSANPLLRNK